MQPMVSNMRKKKNMQKALYGKAKESTDRREVNG